MDNNAAIAELQEELRGLDKVYPLTTTDREQYHREHQRISKAISKLRESQPSNFYSPEPAPEQSELKRLKNRVADAIEPYRFRIVGKDYSAFLIALKFATDAKQVHALYNTWQGKLQHKNIATLPELKIAA